MASRFVFYLFFFFLSFYPFFFVALWTRSSVYFMLQLTFLFDFHFIYLQQTAQREREEESIYRLFRQGGPRPVPLQFRTFILFKYHSFVDHDGCLS